MEQQLADHRICTSDGGQAAQVAVVVDSDVVGVEKPDPAIFRIALDALGLAPDDCLYVGDTVHFDVNGARAAGLRPVHLDPYGLCPGADHPHVGSLSQLAGALIPATSPSAELDNSEEP
jgi:putative hydrolase of the HAD superfamily